MGQKSLSGRAVAGGWPTASTGRMTAFLAVSAVVPAPGGSFVSSMPAPNRWILSAAMRLAGTRPPAKALRRGLGTGLGDEVVDRVVAEFTPESPRLYRDRTGDRAWDGRGGFLSTTLDAQMPTALQRRFAEQLGAEWTEEIATGHLPMLQDPPATAAAIDRFLNPGVTPSCRRSPDSTRSPGAPGPR